MIALSISLAVIGFAIAAFVIWPIARSTPQWRAPLILSSIVLSAALAYFVGAQPGQPGAPYAERAEARLAADPTSLSPAERIERLRDLIREHDQDADSWAQLGRMLARSERELEAISAFQRSLRIEMRAQTLSDLGQTFINLNDGTVTEQAAAAFEEARRLDPALPEPAFFLGLAAFQSGDIEAAEQAWFDILARLDENSPYRILIAQQAFQLLSQPQVSEEAVSQAADDENLEPAARAAAMVERLEARVQNGQASFADWLRVIRIRGLIENETGAIEALNEARIIYADNAGAMAILDLLSAALQQSNEAEE
ncbi:tetratricopeptide repeat protein [Hyphobacterium sp.]|uniref:tetratricopeptide repeat protein n=1 Tax=Hyphobacterium sp. TaxID=2004662 RepID=UPI003BAD85C7